MKTPLLILTAIALAAASVPVTTAYKVEECTSIPGGIIACGEVTGFCGAGAGSGQATASVHWKLVVDTNRDDATDEAYGPAAALSATASCWTDTCTQVRLYANGYLVVQTLWIC